MSAPEKVISPLTGGLTIPLKLLSGEQLQTALEKHYRRPMPADQAPGDYTLYRCEESGLEFFYPLRPAEAPFYEWTSRDPNYYQNFRWEYGKVADLISDDLDALVMDVGCGDGAFLHHLVERGHKNVFGLDLTPASVETCRQRGVPAAGRTVDAALAEGLVKSGQAQTVVSFHCLEHVPDPLGFAKALFALLRPGGCLFLSTPYSPLTPEPYWFDPMNNPPHHLTRWNEKAFRHLAKMLGASLFLYVPPTQSLLRRFRRTLYMAHYGGDKFSWKKQLLSVLKSPLFTARVFGSQWRRARLSTGQIAPDFILTKFVKPE